SGNALIRWDIVRFCTPILSTEQQDIRCAIPRISQRYEDMVKFVARQTRVSQTPDTCADGLSSPSGPQVAQKNFLRLNPSDHVICDGSDDPSPHEPGRVSE